MPCGVVGVAFVSRYQLQVLVGVTCPIVTAAPVVEKLYQFVLGFDSLTDTA